METPTSVLLADVVQCHKVFRLKNNLRKLKRRLEEDPGERPEPFPPGPFLKYKIQEKCGDCMPCKMEECHECDVCSSRSRGSRANLPGPQEVACIAADRMCLLWISPPLPPSSYTSSMASEVTKDSLTKCTQDVEKQMDKLMTATADVMSTAKNAGGKRWSKRQDLTEGNLEATLEGYQDTWYELKQRSESKQITLGLVEGLDDETTPGQGDGEEPPPGGSQTQGQSLLVTSQGGKQKSTVGNLEALEEGTPSMENHLIQERTSNEQLTIRLQEALGELEASTRRQSQRKATKTKEAPPVKAPPNSLSSSLGSGGQRSPASKEERSHTGLNTPTRSEERLDMPPPVTIPL